MGTGKFHGYIQLDTDRTAVWDWRQSPSQSRFKGRWTLSHNEVRIESMVTNISITYEPETKRLIMPDPQYNTTSYAFEKTDEALPAFPIPSEVSKTSDGILGVWKLTAIEGKNQSDPEKDAINEIINNSWYAQRYWFKASGMVYTYESVYDLGELQELTCMNYAVDQKEGVIRMYGSGMKTEEIPFSIDGDELRIIYDDLVQVYTRNYEYASVVIDF